MREPGKMTAILLREQRLFSAPLAAIVELKSLITESCQQEVAAVVEGQGGCGRVWLREFELLRDQKLANGYGGYLLLHCLPLPVGSCQ